MNLLGRIGAAMEVARHGVDRIADAIAPPIGLQVTPERPRAICWDDDHDDPEGACPSCGQGPRRK